jgi:hypothetical protein
MQPAAKHVTHWVLCPSLAFLDISVNLIPEQCLIGIREACANNQIELVGDQQLEQVARPPQMVEANMSQMALGLHRAMQREDERREILRRMMGGEAGNPDQPHIDCVTARFAAAVHFPPTRLACPGHHFHKSQRRSLLRPLTSTRILVHRSDAMHKLLLTNNEHEHAQSALSTGPSISTYW